MAASLAAKLKSLPQVQVDTMAGGFGEFTVLVDQQTVVDTNRFWYPNLTKVLRLVQARLAG